MFFFLPHLKYWPFGKCLGIFVTRFNPTSDPYLNTYEKDICVYERDKRGTAKTILSKS